MASSTTTSYAHTSHCVYDVFINHHGKDCKKPFATDLHKRLSHYDLRVFLDEQELQKGIDFPSEIVGAIREASMHIAVFSQKYASSPWCLKELSLMLQSKKPILPVFYGVDPSAVRWTGPEKQGDEKQGVYARPLAELQKKKTFDTQTKQEKPRYPVEEWRQALFAAANITGFELWKYEGKHDQLIQEVVEKVLKMVKIPVHVCKYPIGLDQKVQDLENLQAVLSLQMQSTKIRVIGIVGLGGVGKTTLVKEFFNRQVSHYDRSCCLFDVRKKSLKSLQRKLFEDLVPGKNRKIKDIEDGLAKITRYVRSRVLMILDNVDDIQQLNALLVPVEAAPVEPGSLILITSRDSNVLKSSGIAQSSIYTLECLNLQQSRELFCLYAFNQPHPVERFALVVEKFLSACGGLPLCLEVIGALLCKKDDLRDWEAQLIEISKAPPGDVQARLKISYDGLDKDEKQMFLDVACFFIGENSDTVVRIWDGSGWNGWLGLRKLENRCLVKVDSEDRIRMHDLLRHLGRYMAKESRLWGPTQDIDNQSPVAVRGIKSFEGYSCLGVDMRRLQLLSGEGDCVKTILESARSEELIYLCWYNFLHSSLPSSIPVKNLRVLKIHGDELEQEVTLWRDKSQAPLQLRELDIAATVLKIPKSIGQLNHLEKVVFKPGNCNAMRLEYLPDEFCRLQSLKHLELNHCYPLKLLPDSFGNLRNLEYIKLVCPCLERLPDSFGNLTNLEHISLTGCGNLQMVPDSIGNCFSNLQHLDLSGCKKLGMLPNIFSNSTKLQHIDFSHCYNLNMPPESLRNLTKLKCLNLKECGKLNMPPDSFQNLIQLEYLNMEDCNGVTISSVTFVNITTLKKLCLPSCEKIEVLPPEVTRQKFLLELSLLCPGLKELPSDMGELRHLKSLHLGSKALITLPDSLGDLESLEELELRFCNRLKCLPYSIRKLTQLKKLSMVKMPILELLEINECSSSELPRRDVRREMHTLPDTRGPKELHVCLNIQHLKIKSCDHLLEVRALPTTLIKLELEGCSVLGKIGGLYGLPNLQTLKISFCGNLEDLSGIETLASLEILSLRQLKKLTSIPVLGQLKKLQILDITECRELKELPSVEDAMSLRKLTASECPNLQLSGGVLEQLRKRLQSCTVG